MLADVAVAVHPEDERYRDAVGREVVVPFVERAVPVVADDLVEPEFGTGALKVTPGHDPVDFEIGRRHELPVLTVIGLDGRMNEAAGELAGLTQKEADEAVVAWLRERDLLEKREPYRHNVGTCERCHTRIEPLVSLQWWLAMEEPRKPALAALVERRVRYHPESQHQFAVRSLEEIPDWNVSRQLWWGHQLPIWYCPDGHASCAWPPPDACAECGSGELVRDPDVLDTWFSSALWPFATLGWPEDTEDLRRYYPGDVNSTAREIIRLWENRMIWTGIELVGDIPVPRRDRPLDRARPRRAAHVEEPRHRHRPAGDDRCARRRRDALRAPEDVLHAGRALLGGRPGGGLEARREALERLAARPRQHGRGRARGAAAVAGGALDPRPPRRDPGRGRGSLEPVRLLARGVKALYSLTFDDFCDWYAEAIKPRLYEDDPDAAATALFALERLLALLHPVMPHVTEEIWAQLPGREARLIVSPWPEPDSRFADDAGALERVRDAAEIARRSGVVVDLPEDERRIFDAVVRKEQLPLNGSREGEIERLRKEVARSEGMLENDNFVANAPSEVVEGEREKLARYRRELDALGG